jgi:esterase/lipase superfamily enzyme
MKTLRLYYATNRKHKGSDRWNPTGYDTKFSDDGAENLRFGRLELAVDEGLVKTHLAADAGFGPGNGNALADALTAKVKKGGAKISPFRESLDPDKADGDQPAKAFGSTAMFLELQAAMKACSDVLVYLHGFNVSWAEAVGSALALQESLNQPGPANATQEVLVVLFTWPSDGQALPYVSYKSDRTEARASGAAVGRALLKTRDFLFKVRTLDLRGRDVACGQELHLLCHSMGNFVLQCALERLSDFTPRSSFPRMFEHVFLCAPDVDDNVLEPGLPLGALHELSQHVTVYHNRGDVAMYVSDYTKGNPERLGHNGAARPAQVHNKVHQVDCTPIVSGLVEHSYYQDGRVNQDIRHSIASLPFDSPLRTRVRSADLPNVWRLK